MVEEGKALLGLERIHHPRDDSLRTEDVPWVSLSICESERFAVYLASDFSD